MPPSRGAAIDQYMTVMTRKAGRTADSHGGSGSTESTSATTTVSSKAPQGIALTIDHRAA